MEMEGKEYQVSMQVGNRRKSFWQKQTQKVKGRLEQRLSGMVQGPSEHIQRRIRLWSRKIHLFKKHGASPRCKLHS